MSRVRWGASAGARAAAYAGPGGWHTPRAASSFLVARTNDGRVAPHSHREESPMNLWIFVISALFTPVVEPLGVSIDEVAPAAVVEPPTPATVQAPLGAEPRYHGIERMLAKLEAGQS